MRRSFSWIISIVLLLVMCIALTGCTLKSKVVGTWQASWIYNGNSFDRTITINRDGTYLSSATKNGLPSDTEHGTWKFDEVDRLLLYEYGVTDTSWPFTLEGGHLKNGDILYTKIN